MNVRGTNLMSDRLDDRLKGKAEQATGKAQEEWGDATDNPEQEDKGSGGRLRAGTMKPRGS
jgi:uncharacterized protein YjbJ (UPF0337 family)